MKLQGKKPALLLKRLTDFDDIDSLRSYLPTEKKCIEWYVLHRWYDPVTGKLNVQCVNKKCTGKHKGYNAKGVCCFKDGMRFKCRDCGKIFSYKVGTIFQNSPLTMWTWIKAYYFFLSDKLGVSSYGLAEHCKVTQTTAFLMLLRIRTTYEVAGERGVFGILGNTQGDEMYYKGKNRFKHANRQSANGVGRAKNPGTSIVGGIADVVSGMVKATKLNNANAKTLTEFILENVVPGLEFHSDEWQGYKEMIEYFIHLVVVHSSRIFTNGKANTNILEGYWRQVKRKLGGRHVKVSDKYLQSYLNETSYRYNYRDLELSELFADSLHLTTVTDYKPLYILRQQLN